MTSYAILLLVGLALFGNLSWGLFFAIIITAVMIDLAFGALKEFRKLTTSRQRKYQSTISALQDRIRELEDEVQEYKNLCDEYEAEAEEQSRKAAQEGILHAMELYTLNRPKFDALLRVYLDRLDAKEKANRATQERLRREQERLRREREQAQQRRREAPKARPSSGHRPWWEVLGVARSATEQEVRKAYIALVKKYHPDRNPGDKAAEARMAEINRANDEAERHFGKAA